MIIPREDSCDWCKETYIRGCLGHNLPGLCDRCNDNIIYMNKYHNLQHELVNKGTGKMKCHGQSMTPIIKSGSLLTFEAQEEYEVGDIVFCKVKGRYIDAHKITKIDTSGETKRYMIANNHGFENGWTTKIYGKAVKAEYKGEEKDL